MNNKRVWHRILICLMLVLGIGLAPARSMKALAVDWEALFNQSGWYDTEHDEDGQAEETQKETEESKKRKKSKKNKKNKQTEETGQTAQTEQTDKAEQSQVEEDGEYTSKDEVAAYIHEFGHLPDNYITKKEAKKLGWVSSEGNLDEVAPGKSIGGDYFGNYEGSLPEKKGRDYYECDIDYTGGYRAEKRIIFSNDGLIFYTEDHYNTFEQLYGEDD